MFGMKSRGFPGSNSKPAGAEGVRQDPVLMELQFDLAVTRRILLWGVIIGLVTLLGLWWQGILRNGYTVFFWALACFVVGALLGFLFGIPRVLQKDTGPDGAHSKDPGNNLPSRANYQLIVNTNLDDVSDWLTKIVVGVGLVELRKIPDLLFRLASMIAGELGANQVPFIIPVLIYFTTVGFLSGYLTTRMFVQRAFRIADLYAEGALDRGGHATPSESTNPVPPSQDNPL
jgi:hypothetical protein